MSHLHSMFGFIVGTSKEWIHLVKGRGWVFELAQDIPLSTLQSSAS
jgi:hypothetical protein